MTEKHFLSKVKEEPAALAEESLEVECLQFEARSVSEIRQFKGNEFRCGSNIVVKVKDEPDVDPIEEECTRLEAEFKQCEGNESPLGSNLMMKVNEEPVAGLDDGVKSKDECVKKQVAPEEPIDAEPISWSQAIVPVSSDPIEAVPVSSLRPVGQNADRVKEKLPSEALKSQFLNKFNRIPARQGHSSQNPASDSKKRRTECQSQMTCSIPVEDGEFPEDPEWFLVGRMVVSAVSTTKGRKLADNEIVHFSFPSNLRWNAHWIVRFSTKRFGEVFVFLFSACNLIVNLQKTLCG